MAVVAGPRRADDGRAEARQHVLEFGGAEHFVLEAEIAGLGTHLLHTGAAFLELRVGEAEMDAAGPLVADIDAGAFLEFGGERGPFLRRKPGPTLVVRRAETLRLHPNQAKIAAGGAERDIAFVDQRRF